MSLKEYLIEKKQMELTRAEITKQAIISLQQAIAWLNSKGSKPVSTNDKVSNEIADALSNIGTLDIISPTNVEEEVVPEAPVAATPVAATSA